MKRITYILLFASLLLPFALNAQTPYDSFAPEATRPMLEADALYEEIVQENRRISLPFDTILCAALIDLQSQSLYIVSLADGSLLASAPLTDEVRKWLSVDPLVDKYIYASPYLYCGGNPIVYKDPDGNVLQAVVGAFVAGATDAAIQIGFNMLTNGDSFIDAVKNVDIKSVAGSAAAGAIGIGIASKITQAAKLYKIGKVGTAIATNLASSAGDAIGSAVSQEISEGCVSAEQVRDDVVFGVIGNAAGKKVNTAIKNSNGYKTAINQLDHAERVANNSNRASRLQRVEKAQKAVDSYGSLSSQAAASGTSSALSETSKQME